MEKEMPPHSIIIAWEIPWTEEPGGLQSMGFKESDTTEGGTGALQGPRAFDGRAKDCGWGLPAPRPLLPDTSMEN